MCKEEIKVILTSFFGSAIISYVALMFAIQYPTKPLFNEDGFKEVPASCWRSPSDKMIYCKDYTYPMPSWLIWSFADYRRTQEQGEGK